MFSRSGARNISGFLKPTYSGVTTSGAKKRIRKAVDLLLQFSPTRRAKNPVTGKYFKHRLSFITLTISSKEKLIKASFGNKNLIAPFIRTMRRKHNMVTYIWKVEFQKNGQIHYHITTPSVIHYQYIKDTWNNLLSKHQLLKNYMKEHPGQFPNSTDIHSVYSKKDMQWYLSKEISKSVQDMSAEGKVWDCSLNLKSTKFFSCIEPSSMNELIDVSKIIYTDHCGIYNKGDPWKKLPLHLQQQYNNWRSSIIDKGLY